MSQIHFQAISWDDIPATLHPGETGLSHWKTIQYDGIRVRIVVYSAGYMAGHWCRKGHIVHCLEGEFVSELQNGDEFRLSQGMSYIVSEDMSRHRSKTESGVKLLIIDGDFLK